MLTVDMLSDSGTTAMTNQQWASLFLGDEAYGRNTGYYVLLDTFRDIFERGGEKNWKKIIDLCPHRLPRRRDHDGERLPSRVRGRPVQRRRRPDGAPQHLHHPAGPCRGVRPDGDRQEDPRPASSGQGVHHPLQRPLRHHRGQHQADGLHPQKPLPQGTPLRNSRRRQVREEPVQGQHGH